MWQRDAAVRAGLEQATLPFVLWLSGGGCPGKALPQDLNSQLTGTHPLPLSLLIQSVFEVWFESDDHGAPRRFNLSLGLYARLRKCSSTASRCLAEPQ
jgi:hypothetical protein